MNNHIYSQLILLNKNDTDHYLRRYVKMVSFFKERNLKKVKGLHHEHHIIPESFGGPDTIDNLVCITIREHFILHWMLYKAFPKSGMVTAFLMMRNCWGKVDFIITSKVYQKLMIENAERHSEIQKKKVLDGTHHFCGKTNPVYKQMIDGTNSFFDKEKARERQNKLVAEGTHPWQDKEKQSKKQRKRVADGTHNFLGGEIGGNNSRQRVLDGTHPFLGGEIQREVAKKQIENGTHNFLGGEIQRKTVRKQLENGTHPFLGKNQIKIECPHCKRIFDKGNFTKHHGDKCKLKLSSNLDFLFNNKGEEI